MELNGRLRTILMGFAVLALLAIAVVTMQGTTMPAAEAVAGETGFSPCTGDCDTCPHTTSAGCPPSDEAHACGSCPSTPTCGAAEACPVDEGCPDAAACATVGDDASVDAERCIGCVRCVNVAPEAFRMNPETGKAEVIDGAPAEAVEHGAEACPVHAVNS
jgi:ferredoxin